MHGKRVQREKPESSDSSVDIGRVAFNPNYGDSTTLAGEMKPEFLYCRLSCSHRVFGGNE